MNEFSPNELRHLSKSLMVQLQVKETVSLHSVEELRRDRVQPQSRCLVKPKRAAAARTEEEGGAAGALSCITRETRRAETEAA